MQLFYNKELTKNSTQITFDKLESRHIIRVLRKKENDILHITNGNGFLFEAKITLANDKKCIATIIAIQEKPKTYNHKLHIAIAPTKSNERFEWFLEKATEIGIDEITPIICQNSERKIVKLERLEKILQAAMKQSLQFTLPKLNPPMKFMEFISQKTEGTKCIAHCETSTKKELKSVVKSSEKTTILIGPEGDFSSEEIQKAIAYHYTPISLGNNRLRTETAGLIATHTVALLNN